MILEGISYLEYTYLGFEYNPSKHSLAEHDGNMSVYQVLDLIRAQGKVEQIITDRTTELWDIKRGGLQPALILLSQYAQPVISDYVAMFRYTIPLMTVSYEENRNRYTKELQKLQEYILSLTVKLYTYSTSLQYNDFVILHGVTAGWSLCQILPYLKKVDDINQSVRHFMCVLVAVFVIQRAQSMSHGMQQALSLKCPRGVDEASYWRRLIAQWVYKLKGEAMEEVFHDEHVYKLVSVALDCLEDGVIDEKLAYLAIRKVAKYPLIVRGRTDYEQDQAIHS